MALQGALDTLDPLKKQQAIEQLFGKFQFSRLNALFENLGRQGSQTLQVLDLMKASSEELATVAGRELTAVTESASGKYRRALEGLKASLAEVGEQFLTINTVLITVIDKIVQFAMNLPGPVKQVLALLGGVTAIAGPLIMLTGLLANFFGNMAKGVFHLKAFFKGGEGFKYLTPEMLAAQKAGKLVEETFYSDAKAASVLQQALRNLLDEFSLLEAKAKSGAMSVNPAVSTMAGNLVMGGSRVVDPSHPLVGAMGTRSSSHMVPRSGMTEAQRLQQTMFGMVPGSGPVNQKIGQNPQIYMEQDLPNVPGLTRINGVSTGIVAGEAARHHAMMATLAMQSKEEIVALKKQIVATGTVSKDLMVQFDGMLPVVSQLTSSAAQQSAMIVAELRAGTINIEQARARIIQLNLDIERMMAQAVQAQAGTLGRTINPTMIPTLNQPVVDPTGKSNMRELFKKGSTRDFINKVAGSLGVRTSGAGYNIETTKPRRMATGGMVYRQDGSMGPEFKPMGTDTVPAMLTPGEFVVKADAVNKDTLPLLQSLNEAGSSKPFLSATMIHQGTEANQALAGNRPNVNLTGNYLANDMSSLHSKGLHPMAIFYDQALRLGYGDTPAKKLKLQQALRNAYVELQGSFSRKGDSPINNAYYEKVATSVAMKHLKTVSRFSPRIGRDVRLAEELIFMGHQRNAQNKGIEPGSLRTTGFDGSELPRHLVGTGSGFSGAANQTHFNLAQELYDETPSNLYKGKLGKGNTISQAFGSQRGHIGAKFAPSRWNMLLNMVRSKIGRAPVVQDARSIALNKKFRSGYANGGMVYMANGGMIPRMGTPEPAPAGYSQGGMVEYLQEGSEAPVRRSAGMGGMGFMMGGMGLQMAGQSVGGTAGSLMSSAGLAMNFMPMLGMLPKLAAGTNVVTGAFKGLTGMIGRATAAAKMFALANPYLLGATVALAGILAIAKKIRQENAEAKKEEILTFGISEKGAKELGIQYESLTDKLKSVREEQKLAADKAKAYFESYTGSGVSGLTLTIQQLKELKERVKTDMPELISTFNSIDTSKVNDLASNLKSQMIASGKSVEEATNLIYALIEASDKAGMGVSAISNKIFSGIVDQGSAANFIMKNFGKSVDNIYNVDPEAFASNVDTVISSLDSAVKSLIGTKNSTGQTIDEAMAISIQMENIANSGVKNKQLGAQALAVLKQQRPEYAYILNSSDTIGGMYAKWRLVLANVRIDLSKISSEQAELLASFTQGLNDAADASLKTTDSANSLQETALTLADLEKKQKAASTAAKNAAAGTAGLSKAVIKGIQEEIKAIRERAEAKKRALRETFDRENAELELQQAKLDLQMAVARGDNEAAAAAQIRIQQIQKESSLKSAEARIDENAKKAEAIQQKKLDDDAEKKSNQATVAGSKGKTADNLGAEISKIKDLGKQLTDVAILKAQAEEMMKVDKKAGQVLMDEAKQNFSNFLRSLGKAAETSVSVRSAFEDYLKKDAKGNITSETKPGNEAFTLKRSGLKMGEGEAFTELDKLSKQYTSFAEKVIGKGGKTLSDIWAVLNQGTGGKPGQQSIKVEPKDLNTLMTKLGKPDAAKFKTSGAGKGDLEDQLRRDIITQYGLKKDDTFEYNGIKYRVTGSGLLTAGASRVTPRMAMGGYVKKYSSGSFGGVVSGPGTGKSDSIPAMLSNGEYVLNAAATQKFGVPLLDRMNGSYNIPSGSSNSVQGGVNSSYNNNVYNIDIALNGTNVNVNDIMKTMKAEMALIGAKEGRVRTLGGNY
jgi:hypothetical protein